MQIKYENIILRDMIESDIEDYVRWFTVDREWEDWDAPWEKEDTDEENERTSWRKYYESVKDLADEVRRWKFEIEWNGRHIGWVSSYCIDENYEWIGKIKEGQTVYRAVGIDICEPDLWGNGIGTNALRAFVNYYLENGVDKLYMQTWSGNVRMIKCAEKLGFCICKREASIRTVRGGVFDGLTFGLDVKKFQDYLIARINERYQALSRRFGMHIQIKTLDCLEKPRYQVVHAEDGPIIYLNRARIPLNEYEENAGYHVGKLLLPRLVLQTERLVLRRYREEDAKACFAFLSDPDDAYMDCCKAFTAMDEAFYERVALFDQRETQYMIVLKESSEVIGTVNVFADDSRAVDAMEIGYGISRAHQRKGYAFEALFALLGLLQKDLCLEMVTAGVLKENIASIRLLEKLGFQQEGVRHKAVWHEGLARPVDLVYYYRDRQK